MVKIFNLAVTSMSSSYVSAQGMFALVFWRLALEAPSTQSILRSSDSYTEYSPPDIKHIQRSLHIVGYLPYCRSTMHGVGHSLTLDGTASDYQQRGGAIITQRLFLYYFLLLGPQRV